MLRRWPVLALAFSAVCSCNAWGDTYPSRPVRVIVPFGAGGPDTIARVVGQQLAVQVGQTFVIDNRPGANGIVGTDAVAKAAPDGYTLILVSASFVMFANTTLALPHIKAGKLRALGVTGRTRLAALPDVPTLTESGVPGMEIDAGWFGMFAPAKTPPEIVTKLYNEIRAALANPQVRERLLEQGFVPVGNSPVQFKAYVEAEIKAYAEMVRLAKIQPE